MHPPVWYVELASTIFVVGSHHAVIPYNVQLRHIDVVSSAGFPPATAKSPRHKTVDEVGSTMRSVLSTISPYVLSLGEIVGSPFSRWLPSGSIERNCFASSLRWILAMR